MVILSKKTIAAYAEAILDIMENNPSKENTKNIHETLEIIYADWENEPESPDKQEVSAILDNLTRVADNYVGEEDSIDFDCDEMVTGLMALIKLGNQ